MMNNQTLKTELKRSLGSLNYPVVIIGNLLLSFLGLLLMMAYYPELWNASIVSHIGYTLTMGTILIGLMIGLFTSGIITQYYTPKVLRYVDLPKTIDSVQDQMITIASLIAIDFPDNLKKVGNFFSYLNQLLNEFRTHLKRNDEQIKTLNETKVDKSEFLEMQKTYMDEYAKINKKYQQEKFEKEQAIKELDKLKNKENEKIQKMNENVQGRDITENSNLDKDKKFEDDL